MMLDKKVKEIMTTDVITTPSNVDVVNAFEELMEHKISAMPVVDDGELVGIITATDLSDAAKKIIAAVKEKQS